jgi:hypothetical protein
MLGMILSIKDMAVKIEKMILVFCLLIDSCKAVSFPLTPALAASHFFFWSFSFLVLLGLNPVPCVC